MTKQELKKLSRADLIEMLIQQTRESEAVRDQLQQAQAQLNNRTVACENAGSIAEAALQLNGVFESAQAACDQYIENIRQKNEEIEAQCNKRQKESEEYCKRLEKETEERCSRKEKETEINCNLMVKEAELKSRKYWNEVSEKVDKLMSQSAMLRGILNDNKSPEQ